MGMLTIAGTTILVILGIAMCAYATSQQLVELHSTGWDTVLFGTGLTIISFNAVRRLVWLCLGLTIPWSGAVAVCAYFGIGDQYRFEYTLPLVALCVIPPVLAAIMLEIRWGRSRQAYGPYLEISLTESQKK